MSAGYGMVIDLDRAPGAAPAGVTSRRVRRRARTHEGHAIYPANNLPRSSARDLFRVWTARSSLFILTDQLALPVIRRCAAPFARCSLPVQDQLADG
jgi:hypothetical protein